MVLHWKFSSNRPVYIQIMDQIRNAIVTGELEPGGRVSPVRELAAQAQVNPNTMQRALVELEREHLLVTCSTAGRFVTSDPQILENLRNAALDAVIRDCAAQFAAAGITIDQAVQMLLALKQEEEKHG